MARAELKPVFDFCEQNGFEINENDPFQLTFTIKKKVEKTKVRVVLTELNTSVFSDFTEMKIIIDKSLNYVTAEHLCRMIEIYLSGEDSFKADQDYNKQKKRDLQRDFFIQKQKEVKFK